MVVTCCGGVYSELAESNGNLDGNCLFLHGFRTLSPPPTPHLQLSSSAIVLIYRKEEKNMLAFH
jgi:hypothetical protein